MWHVPGAGTRVASAIDADDEEYDGNPAARSDRATIGLHTVSPGANLGHAYALNGVELQSIACNGSVFSAVSLLSQAEWSGPPPGSEGVRGLNPLSSTEN
jgi:hypothetical protein